MENNELPDLYVCSNDECRHASTMTPFDTCLQCGSKKEDAFAYTPKATATAQQRIEELKLKFAAHEYDIAKEDAEWEEGHPIFQMAQDNDNLNAKVKALQSKLAVAVELLKELKLTNTPVLMHKMIDNKLKQISSL